MKGRRGQGNTGFIIRVWCACVLCGLREGWMLLGVGVGVGGCGCGGHDDMAITRTPTHQSYTHICVPLTSLGTGSSPVCLSVVVHFCFTWQGFYVVYGHLSLTSMSVLVMPCLSVCLSAQYAAHTFVLYL